MNSLFWLYLLTETVFVLDKHTHINTHTYTRVQNGFGGWKALVKPPEECVAPIGLKRLACVRSYPLVTHPPGEAGYKQGNAFFLLVRRKTQMTQDFNDFKTPDKLVLISQKHIKAAEKDCEVSYSYTGWKTICMFTFLCLIMDCDVPTLHGDQHLNEFWRFDFDVLCLVKCILLSQSLTSLVYNYTRRLQLSLNVAYRQHSQWCEPRL